MINNAKEKRYNVIQNEKKIRQDYLTEHQVISEMFLNVSRILGFFILFGISFLNNILYFKILLVFVTLAIIRYAGLMVKLNKTN